MQHRTNEIFLFDDKIRKQFNVNLLAGVDEAGRGCISGPIVAAAVVFDTHTYITNLKESKSVSYHKRKELFKQILSSAKSVSCCIAKVEIINKYGIGKANMLVMKHAVEKLTVKPELVIVDGYYNPYIVDVLQCNIIKADKKSAVVAAASIIAKVIRDTIMEIYYKIIPVYCFNKNKGYPTKEHTNIVSQIGISDLHRYYAYKFVVSK